MTEEVPQHGRARGASSRRRSLAAVAASPVVVCLGAALLAGGGTYALWADEDTFLGGVITAGDLTMETGTPTWKQITSGVWPGASGELATTPTGFRSMPGDVVEIAVPVTTMLRGDNLNAGFSVEFARPEVVSQDVTDGLISVGYHVEDADGDQVAPASGQAPVGTTVVVPGLVGDDDGAEDQWIVVVTVHVLGDYVWVTPATEDFPGAWAAGDLIVRLEQVRTGPGYRTAGGSQ